MKSRVCLACGLGLVGSFAVPSTASARDTSGKTLAWAAATPQRPNPIPEMAHFPAIAASLVSDAEKSGRARNDSPTDAVDLDASDDVNLSQLCKKQCGTVKEIRRLPRAIVDNLAGLPVLGAFVVPVTEGLTIENAEGLPVVTFAVKPTKFGRGSGFVASGRF
jgi:hypothetical protein